MSTLTELRARIATAVTGLDPDWVVLEAPTDAAQPPCFMVDWGPDPAGTRTAFCSYTAQAEVIVIPGRLTTEGVYPILEQMLSAAVGALDRADLPAWQWLGPAPLEIAQITYLSCRIQLRQPATF